MAQVPKLIDRVAPATNATTPDRKRRRKRSQRNNDSSLTPPRAAENTAPETQCLNIETEVASAGPSTQTMTSSPSSPHKASKASNSADFGEEYISFAPSDSEDDSNTRRSENARGKEPVRDRYEREWDRGKRRERSRERGEERKRKYDAINLDDERASQRRRTGGRSMQAPWVYDIEWDRCKNVAEMLNLEVEAFTQWMSPTLVEDEIRELTVTLIARAITGAFPDAKVMPFGSYETKLYLPSGDIDLVIVSNSMGYSNKVSVLHRLAAVLKRAGITSSVTVIAKAKVPIVKFITAHGRFNVDISINQTNGVVGGQVIKGFLQSMAGNGLALRSLVFITKLFLSQRSMNEVFTGGLGSYSIVCLAISFLQMHPKIRKGEINTERNLGVLMMEFFELYGCYFNYDEVGISVRDGGTYFSKRKRGWYDPGRRSMLSIEDPVDPNNDISSGSYGFAKVRATLAGAHGILTSTAYLRAGIISSRRKGKDVRLRKEHHPEDLSVLLSIIGVAQETINHRRLIQEVYDRHILHDILQVKPRVPIYHQPKIPEPCQSSPKLSSKKETYSRWKEMGDGDSSITRDTHKNEHDIEENGRYDIGRQPPKKRRRHGGEKDAHTVFIADDDERDSGSGSSDEDANKGDDKAAILRKKSASSLNHTKRRSYWLSKGIGEGISDDSI